MMACPDALSLRYLRCLTVLLTGVVGGGVHATAAQPAPLSQIDVTLALSIGEMQKKLRAAAAGAPGVQSKTYKERKSGGVGADVTATPNLGALSLTADAKGTFTLRVPIAITVKAVRPGATALAVDVVGCGPTSFNVSVAFDPIISDDGRLAFGLGPVTADNARYVCRIKTNAVGDVHEAVKNRGVFGVLGDVITWKGIPVAADVDVTQAIRARMQAVGSDLAGARIEQINRLLPDDRQLQRMIQRPAVFGKAVTLGIDRAALRVRRVAAKGDVYQLIGVLQGRPRLLFVDRWSPDTSDVPDAATVDAVDGFRLPATLLFPTSDTLVPDPTLQNASGWLGSFRLHPVPNKPDLAVLQRRSGEGAKNVVWLSGGQHQQAPVKTRTFDRPMDNVLQEIFDWLNDPQLWQGVEGVAEMKREVLVFKRLLENFQAETRVPLDGRGSLRFYELVVNLRSLWVTDEAILADVVLHGRARLDLNVAL